MADMNDTIYRLIREHYKTLVGYVSAGMEAGKKEGVIYLNANENPHELPGLEGLNRYPEPQPPALLEAFARAYDVEAENIVITRGADEAIVILTKIFCEPHQDSILITPPTFGMYAVDARAMPANVVEVPLICENGVFSLNKKKIIEMASQAENKVKLVYLCSPNNPTGTSFSHDDLAEIADELEGKAVIILDETYAEFSVQGSMTEDLESTPNLIILRTLSKSYAFAGMRMGCLISSDQDFIKLVRTKALDAYPIPRLSIEAAFHVLSPEISAIAHENIKKLIAERTRIEQILQKHPQIKHVYPSDANFLLVQMQDARGFCQFAAENNVILRDFSDKAGTENCLRISIGTPEQNDAWISLLDTFPKK